MPALPQVIPAIQALEAHSSLRVLHLHSFGNTLSGGFEPGGLIERMKAMIFHSWSEVLMAAPIGGIGACTVPYVSRV